jgi:acetyltransferase
MSWEIEALDRDAVRRYEPVLIALLQDTVDGGASVGFLPPLAPSEAKAYWRLVGDAVGAGTRVLLVARVGTDVLGTGQLDLATRPNARHRAEVMKLMVHRTARRRGIGRALMQALEVEACRLGRTTLVLDTRAGDPSEQLYRSVGWQLAGVIPRYARSVDGRLDPSAFYYRLLKDGGATA